jgi:hypothetical protein
MNKRTTGGQTPKRANARQPRQTAKRHTSHTSTRAREKQSNAPQAPRPGSEEARKAGTAAARAKFLETFAKVGNVRAASELSGIARRTHYNWLQTDPAYAEAFGDAKSEAVDRLEYEARRRALVGVEEPVYGRLPGVNAGIGVVGYVRKFSDALLIFLLKNLRPEVYTSRHELTGKNGAPLNPATAAMDLSKLTLDELAALERLVLKSSPDAQDGARHG